MGEFDFICKGTVIPKFVGFQNSMMWDVVQNVAYLFIIGDLSIQQSFKLDGHYDFGIKKIDSVIFITIKVGKNRWASAPYSPHFSSYYEPGVFYGKTGLPLFICKVSNETGAVIDIDFLVLGNSFSNYFMTLVNECLNEPFDPKKYQKDIERVYAQYSDVQLSEISDSNYSID